MDPVMRRGEAQSVVTLRGYSQKVVTPSHDGVYLAAIIFVNFDIFFI